MDQSPSIVGNDLGFVGTEAVCCGSMFYCLEVLQHCYSQNEWLELGASFEFLKVFNLDASNVLMGVSGQSSIHRKAFLVSFFPLSENIG